MAPFSVMTTLASILALSTSVAAYTGSASGLPIASVTVGAPYPISNGTHPHGPTGFPTGTSPFTLPTPSCPVPTTVTSTESITVTVTVTPTTSVTVPYPISGSTGLPVGPTGTGTGTYPFPTGFAKRMEMRGLKQVNKEKRRGMRFW